jgi:hypothetical protein
MSGFVGLKIARKPAAPVVVISDEPERPVFVSTGAYGGAKKKTATERVDLSLPGVSAVDVVTTGYAVRMRLSPAPDLDQLRGRMFPDYRTFFDPGKRRSDMVSMRFSALQSPDLNLLVRVFESGAVEATGSELRQETPSAVKIALETVLACIRRCGQPAEPVAPPTLATVTCVAELQRDVDLQRLASAPGVRLSGEAAEAELSTMDDSTTVVLGAHGRLTAKGPTPEKCRLAIQTAVVQAGQNLAASLQDRKRRVPGAPGAPTRGRPPGSGKAKLGPAPGVGAPLPGLAAAVPRPAAAVAAATTEAGSGWDLVDEVGGSGRR